MVIGVTGTNNSGKGKLVEVLIERGFRMLSLSDRLRIEAKRLGIDANDRAVLQKLGNAYRTVHGAGGLMQATLMSISDRRGHYVIDSIRTPAEVAALRAYDPLSLLLAMDADINNRFIWSEERKKTTGRHESATTLEEFGAREAVENTDNPYGQQLRATIQLSDALFYNRASSPEDLKSQLHTWLDQFSGTNVR